MQEGRPGHPDADERGRVSAPAKDSTELRFLIEYSPSLADSRPPRPSDVRLEQRVFLSVPRHRAELRHRLTHLVPRATPPTRSGDTMCPVFSAAQSTGTPVVPECSPCPRTRDSCRRIAVAWPCTSSMPSASSLAR